MISTPEETGGSGIQGHSWIHSKFSTSLGFVRPCPKEEQKVEEMKKCRGGWEGGGGGGGGKGTEDIKKMSVSIEIF